MKLAHDDWQESLRQDRREAAFERNHQRLHALALQLGADMAYPRQGHFEWWSFMRPLVYSPAIRGWTRGGREEFRMTILSDKDRDAPSYGAPRDIYFKIPWLRGPYLTRAGKWIDMDTWCVPYGKETLRRALMVREAIFAPRIFQKTCRRRIVRDEEAQERAFQWVDLLRAHAVHPKAYPLP